MYIINYYCLLENASSKTCQITKTKEISKNDLIWKLMSSVHQCPGVNMEKNFHQNDPR